MLLRNDEHPLSLSPHIFPDPQTGVPLTELFQIEMLPFQTTPTISKIPSQRTHQVPQWAPTERERETPVSKAFFYHFSTNFKPNELPLCSPTRSLWREKLHLQRQWFIHSFISVRVPNKEPSHEKRGKYLVTVHGAPLERQQPPGRPRAALA